MSKLQEILKKGTEEIDSLLNTHSNNYQEKLSQLSLLLKDGKTDSKAVDLLNEILMKDLLSVSENSNIKINLVENKDAFLAVMDTLDKKRDFLIENNFSYDALISVFNSFEDEMSSVIKNLIKIEVPEKKIQDNIVNEYVDNYLNLISLKGGTPKFSERALAEYLNFLEYSIKSDQEELQLNEEIDSHIKNSISLFKDIFENCISVNDYESLLKLIRGNMSWVIDPAAKNDVVEGSIKSFQNGLRTKVVNLAIKANSEVFPNLLERKISKRKEENEEVVNKLSASLTFLEEERRLLFTLINKEGLYFYGSFVKTDELINNSSFDTVSQDFNRIYHIFDPELILRDFLKKRNEMEEGIKFQIQGREKSYTSIKNKIEEIETIESTDDIVLYFINSVKLFQQELEHSMIGDLKVTFQDVLADQIKYISVYSKIKKHISQEIQTLKQNSLLEKQYDLIKKQISEYKIPNRLAKEFVEKTSEDLWFSPQELEKEIKIYLSNLTKSDLFEEKDQISNYLNKLKDLNSSSNKENLKSGLDIAEKIMGNPNFQALTTSFLGKITGADLIVHSAKTFYDVYKGLSDSNKSQEEINTKIYEIKVSYFSQVASSFVKDSLIRDIK